MATKIELKHEKLPAGILLCGGNPLLDIAANVDQAFLDKYSVKANDAILFGENQTGIYDDLVKNYKVEYIAGGSAQNTARVAAWLLRQPNVIRYSGSVGSDEFAKTLEAAARADGVDTYYQHVSNVPTGTCAVCLTGKDRSLIANLSAANEYKIDHILQPENAKLLADAQVFYYSGFFLTVSPPTAIHVGKYASEHNKIFVMNTSAPFIVEFFKDPFWDLFPYSDYLFGNDDEFKVLARVKELGTTDLEEIALKVAALPKANAKRSRTVIITCGAEPTIVAKDGQIRKYPVWPVKEIVDTNGAGDAYVGGFLSQLIQGSSEEQAVYAASYAAGHIIQVSGCSLTATPEI